MSIVCLGELLIDFVALEHGVAVGDASGFKKAPGGAPANVAVAVARLGHPSAFLGQVGDDPFGHYLAGVLEADKIDVSGLRFSPDARTALAFVSLRADGERSSGVCFPCYGANDHQSHAGNEPLGKSWDLTPRPVLRNRDALGSGRKPRRALGT